MFLRRSVHRLEKGIIAKDRRSVFATDYIVGTVDTFFGLLHLAPGTCDADLAWASEVLDEYFSVVPHGVNDQVDRARHRWNVGAHEGSENLRPFVRGPLPPDSASVDGLEQLAFHRRSVRYFLPKPVDRAAIMRAVGVGLSAPSACNRQSIRFVIADEQARAALLASVPMGTAGFAHQIPALGIIVGQLRGYASERDRHAIYVDGGLFAMGMLLALEGQGISSCCINWPDQAATDKRMRDLITLDEDERIIMLVAMGYEEPGQLVPRSHKRSPESIVDWLP